MRINLCLFLAALVISSENLLLVAKADPVKVDPLSLGPLNYTESRAKASRKSLSEAILNRDKECHLSLENQRLTYLAPDDLRDFAGICDQQDRRMIYTPKKSMLLGCEKGEIAWSAKVSIGSKGLGKMRQGDRKTPVGTYWLGYPRKSTLFGIFIPVGYPNRTELSLGYTGQAIGVHGPMRPFACLPNKNFEKHWTQGCLAVARDQQILEISDWVLLNWPVQLEVRTN